MKIAPTCWRRFGIPFLTFLFATSLEAQIIRPVAGGAVSGLFQEDVEVQTSGPVHEGFASPVVFDEESEAFYTEVDPPHVIEETPPLERPSGYAEWVPGYWSWDDDRRSWLWVCGTWRVPPPGYVWIQGYWIRTWHGWRYVSGFWAPVGYGTGEIDYLPAPPPSLEAGPIGYAPWANAIWVPGNWVWYGGGYMGWMWRQGYWVIVNPGWIWVPARYVWTPYGYIYIEGHWDYSVEHCGLLFAPVYFRPGLYLTSGFAYSPSFVINITLFSAGFFTRPAYCHYYFGDYYAETYWNAGIYPAYSFHYSKFGYDPHFAYASWKYGNGNPQWVQQQKNYFMQLRAAPEARPPKTLAQQRVRKGPMKFAPGVDAPTGGEVAVGLKEVGSRATNLKVEKIPEAERPRLTAQVKDMQKARAERVKAEASQGGPVSDRGPGGPRRIKTGGLVPGAVAEAASKGGGVATPPKRPDLPKAEVAEQPQPGPGRGRGKPSKLRNPSLDDVPPERLVGGRRDDPPGKKPGDDDPVKKPGGDVGKQSDRRPGGGPPDRKVDDDPVKKPGGDVGKQPDRRPGGGPPDRKVDDDPVKKPGGDVGKQPDRRPGGGPPDRKVDDDPVKKPGGDVGKQPDRRPGGGPPDRKVDDDPVKKPGGKTAGDAAGKPAPGRLAPVPPPKDPRGVPGGKPGEKPKTLKPGEQPESQPVKQPPRKPGQREKE